MKNILVDQYPIGILLIFILFFFSKRMMSNQLWRATMTPLASIIGSGFLIAAPLLNELSGEMAPLLMFALCLTSYGLGEVIRWNIETVEPLVQSGLITGFIKSSEKISGWAIAFAYVLSITYYLYLFSSFLLNASGHHEAYLVKAVASLVFVVITYYGHQNGLGSLEKIEGVSVNIKLSIIFTFILGLLIFNFTNSPNTSTASVDKPLNFEALTYLAGLLIMVQGFETSRYLSERYDAKTRVKSMRISQLLSSFVYLAFIFLFVPVFDLHPLGETVTETSVIDVGKYVFKLAPLFLLVAAIASQLSAAVADLGGAGGLIDELTKKKISSKNAYILICITGIIIILSFDIFKIISYASKAFALYYFFQCLTGAYYQMRKSVLKAIFSSLMAVVCLFVVLFGKSFE